MTKLIRLNTVIDKITLRRLNLLSFLIVGIVLFSSTSCVNTKKSLYFADQKDTILMVSNLAPKAVIQNNDLLSISISSLNPEASALFNTPNTSGTTANNSNGGTVQSFGYLVNSDGNVQIPILGNIKASGITQDDLKFKISKELIDKKLLNDPVVTIRNLNFKVTVLGEVGKPTVISVPTEKISLLEAIGLAGDLTIYANRQNVLLVREEENKKITKRIDLNSTELFTSSYYYLKPNDVIYVEPNKVKINSANRNFQWAIPIITGIISLAVTVILVATR